MIKIDPRSGKNHEWTNRHRKKKGKTAVVKQQREQFCSGRNTTAWKTTGKGKSIKYELMV